MLYSNTLTFLQRLQQAATHGRFHYTTGEIDLDSYERLARKFAVAYETQLSRQTKQKRRRAGEASSALYAVRLSARPNEHGKIVVYWVLLASEGAGRVHEREQLMDLRNPKTRLTARNGRYELVHDGSTWSWRLTHMAFNKYADRIHRIASLPPDRRRTIEIDGVRRDADAEKLLDQLYNEPGFRLLRRQIGNLASELRREWRRLRPANGPRLSERTFLAYVRFLPNMRPNDIASAPSPSTEAERRELFRNAFGGDF